MQKDIFYSMMDEDRRISVKCSCLGDLSWKFQGTGVSGAEFATNMQTDIVRRVREAVQRSNERRAAVHSEEELAQYKKYVQEVFLNGIGRLPETDAPLNPQIIEVQQHQGFYLEKLIFESRPHVYVTCNIYRPATPVQLPGPAVLMVQGHYTEGKCAEEYQNVAQTLVHAGLLVMMIDPFGQGERFEHYEPDIDYQTCLAASTEHNLMDSKFKCAGVTLARYFTHDGVRALEYLASRSDVDPNRIALTGNSGGGTQTYLITAAAHEKLAAIAPCSFNCDMTAIAETCTDLDNEQLWTGVLGHGVDYADILGLFAPKPVLLLCNEYDFFPSEGAERTFEKIQTFWKQTGAQTMPEIAWSQTGHAYTPSLAKIAGTFFAKHLGLPEPDYSTYVFRPIERKMLYCTPEGMVAKHFPDACLLQAELDNLYSDISLKRAVMGKEADRQRGMEWLRSTVIGNRKEIEPHTKLVDDGGCLNYVFRQLIWRAQENYWGTGMLLRDSRFGNRPLPVVIALWPDGLRALRQHSVWIHRQCSEGKEVFVVDLAASGALSVNNVSGRQLDIGWGTKYVFNGLLMCLGDSIAATRAYQAMRIPKALAAMHREAPLKISYYGEGEFSRYAKIAALLNGMEVKTDDRYQTWGEIVCDKYADTSNYMDWLMPGAAAYADMDDIDRWLREDGLLK